MYILNFPEFKGGVRVGTLAERLSGGCTIWDAFVLPFKESMLSSTGLLKLGVTQAALEPGTSNTVSICSSLGRSISSSNPDEIMFFNRGLSFSCCTLSRLVVLDSMFCKDVFSFWFGWTFWMDGWDDFASLIGFRFRQLGKNDLLMLPEGWKK